MKSLLIKKLMAFFVLFTLISHFNETSPLEWTEFSCILKPSPIEGIGVFATHDIPAGTLLFTRIVESKIMKIKDVPTEFLRYCDYINDEECDCPKRFDHIEIECFINHSATPNIALKDNIILPDGTQMPRCFYALNDIKAGDELVLNYNTLNEPEHLKEDFYNRIIQAHLN